MACLYQATPLHLFSFLAYQEDSSIFTKSILLKKCGCLFLFQMDCMPGMPFWMLDLQSLRNFHFDMIRISNLFEYFDVPVHNFVRLFLILKHIKPNLVDLFRLGSQYDWQRYWNLLFLWFAPSIFLFTYRYNREIYLVTFRFAPQLI